MKQIRTRGKILYVAAFAVIVGIVVSFCFQDSNGPNPAWIHAGASVALILITWQYVVITNRTLVEAEKSRLQSFIPLLVLRSRGYSHNLGFPVKEIILLNAGSGTALRIEYSTSVVRMSNPDISSNNKDKHPQVTTCIQGVLEKNDDALGPSFGNMNSGMTIHKDNMNFTGTEALRNSNFGAVVLYEDVLGRGYCTLYVGCRHIFSELYESDTSEKRKNSIRKTLLDARGTAELSKLVREYGREFWREIVAYYEIHKAAK